MYCAESFRRGAAAGLVVRLALCLCAGSLGVLAPGGAAMAGDGILYEQDAQFLVGSFDGIQINTFLQPEDAAYSSQGADDFTVRDPAGWSITQISFLAGGTPANPTAANVRIYP